MEERSGKNILVVVMKYLRGSWCVMVLWVFICFSAAGECGEEYESEFSNSRQTIRVKFEGGDYYLKSGEGWVYLKSADTLGGGGSPVIFMDANGDGNADVFVKIYDGRVEGFYCLFLLNPSANGFVVSEQGYIFGDPKIDSHGILSSFEHIGPFVKVEQYRSHDGKIYKYQERIPLSAEVERASFYSRSGEVISTSIKFSGSDDAACSKIVADKAFFYTEPEDGMRLDMYLVRGDLARIVDVTPNGEWLKVKYSNKENVTGWLRSSKAIVASPGVCGSLN
jgi:hypothetical protein